MGAKKRDHASVESIRHADKRANIPTEELRDFVAEEERAPKKVLYPRDPSLDPQLVWTGKDEQDSADLEVPAVPIYVQEKIHPQAIIENLRETASEGELEPELTLFDDYDGLEFEELIDFYQHEQNWANRMILGDSLLVMTSLAEKEGLKGQVQMIYMDPPYGIKFGSNWQVSTRKPAVADQKAEDATRQPEQVKAFRDTWEQGIHSYLAYMRDRLVVARELLSPSGSVFVQIGEDNVHLVRSILDEVFGPENFCRLIAFQKTSGAGSGSGRTDILPGVIDHILWYARDASSVKYRALYKPKNLGEEGASKYGSLELADGTRRPLTPVERSTGQLPPDSRVFRLDNLTSSTGVEKTRYTIEIDGKEFRPHPNVWKTGEEGMRRLIAAGRVQPMMNSLAYVRYLDDFAAYPLNNVWTDIGGIQSRSDPKVYVVQTATTAIQRCVLMTTDPGDLVLDPTCGSGTTAVVAEQRGRRWITIDTSRVAIALARTRVMCARFPYYTLADSAVGARKEAELSGTPPSEGHHTNDIKRGFVYNRLQHIMLKSIANNPDIAEGMSRSEIEAAIRRHSEPELLFDQPMEDGSKLRVAGPFSVESLSPHRVLDTDAAAPSQAESADFAAMILDNLRRAGVQNMRKEERLVFTSIDSHAGEWINAIGDYDDATGDRKRAAISIGPEHGTVGSDQIKEAAKEAMRGIGYDLLIVLGFAFEARTGETATEIGAQADSVDFAAAETSRQYGKLRVLLARMNPDLAMGEELLKKTGAGNLFMVFGEPDVEVRVEDGQIVVAVRGVDVYDPTTGQVRSDSTDDIACWFVDTNYNGESFFVRHAYFTGASDPYRNLRKALKADIDERAWSTLYSTESRPFDRPSSGRIAVKVINHYGDEVMSIYDV